MDVTKDFMETNVIQVCSKKGKAMMGNKYYIYIYIFFYQLVPLVGLEGIVHTNVDQTAFLAVTSLKETVNLAVNLDGKDLTVTRVMFLKLIYISCAIH